MDAELRFTLIAMTPFTIMIIVFIASLWSKRLGGGGSFAILAASGFAFPGFVMGIYALTHPLFTWF